MSSQYFQRNNGAPLFIKLGILLVALYPIYLLLKVFAVVLAALFVLFKYVLLVALVAFLGSVLLKALFGINLFPFKSNQRLPYYRKY